MTNKAQEESSPTTTTTPTTTTSMQQPPPPSSSSTQKKIKVHLVAVGSAPILKKSKFLMNRTDNFGVAISFLRKRLKLGDTNSNSGSSTTAAGSNAGGSAATSSSSSSLFLYINSAFVPSPTEQIGDLYDCFGMREELVIHYSLQEAWGWILVILYILYIGMR